MELCELEAMNKILLQIFPGENKLGLTFFKKTESFYCPEMSLAGELVHLEGWSLFLTDQNGREREAPG